MSVTPCRTRFGHLGESMMKITSLLYGCGRKESVKVSDFIFRSCSSVIPSSPTSLSSCTHCQKTSPGICLPLTLTLMICYLQVKIASPKTSSLLIYIFSWKSLLTWVSLEDTRPLLATASPAERSTWGNTVLMSSQSSPGPRSIRDRQLQQVDKESWESCLYYWVFSLTLWCKASVKDHWYESFGGVEQELRNFPLRERGNYNEFTREHQARGIHLQTLSCVGKAAAPSPSGDTERRVS